VPQLRARNSCIPNTPVLRVVSIKHTVFVAYSWDSAPATSNVPRLDARLWQSDLIERAINSDGKSALVLDADRGGRRRTADIRLARPIHQAAAIRMRLDAFSRCAAPSLRLDLPDAVAPGERIGKSPGPNDRLALNRYGENSRDYGIGERTLDTPKAQLVRQVLGGNTKVCTPFLHICEPIAWGIWIQPAVGSNTVNDDCSVPEDV